MCICRTCLHKHRVTHMFTFDRVAFFPLRGGAKGRPIWFLWTARTHTWPTVSLEPTRGTELEWLDELVCRIHDEKNFRSIDDTLSLLVAVCLLQVSTYCWSYFWENALFSLAFQSLVRTTHSSLLLTQNQLTVFLPLLQLESSFPYGLSELFYCNIPCDLFLLCSLWYRLVFISLSIYTVFLLITFFN